MSWNREFVHGDDSRRVACRRIEGDLFEVLVGDTRYEVRASRLTGGRVGLEFDGRRHVAAAAPLGGGSVQVRVDGRTWSLKARSGGRGGGSDAASGELRAPMTGTLLSVAVEVGQKVAVGDAVAVVTAMKMEHKLVAEIEGEVAEIGAAPGDNVDEGALIVRIE